VSEFKLGVLTLEDPESYPGRITILSVTLINFIKYNKGERPCLTTFPKTENKVENITHRRVFLMNLKVFLWKCGNDQTLSQVFSTSSKSKLKLRRNSKNFICKLRSNI